jgi:hypothetical protein
VEESIRIQRVRRRSQPRPSRIGSDLRRMARLAAEARRALGGGDSGRAWINGAEVGGTDPRYAHLNRSYD